MQQCFRLSFGFCLIAVFFMVGCDKQQNPSSDSVLGSANSLTTEMAGGARIEKPFQKQFSGAECYSGGGEKYVGDVAFSFPSRTDRVLSFTIGPLRDGFSPGQENNKPYDGAGTYSNIGIALKPSNGKSITGFGTITVNPDLQSGSFVLNDNSASGTWNCGHKL